MKFILTISIAAAFLLCGCAVDEEVKPQQIDDEEEPVVTVSEVTPYSVHIEGMFGKENDTSLVAGVRYSLQNTRFVSTAGYVAEAEYVSKGHYKLDLDGLYSDTTYYFCTYVYRDGNYHNSDVYSFRTNRLTAKTNDASDIYSYGAQLGLTLSESIDSSKFKGSYGVYYSTRSRVIRESSVLLCSPYSVTGLLPDHDYYYAAFVCQKTSGMRDVYIWGETKKFTTPALSVVTDEPDEISTFSAHFQGQVSVKFSDTDELGFLLFERNRNVTIDSVGVDSDQAIVKVDADYFDSVGYGSFAATYKKLKSSKRYFCRAYAIIHAKSGNSITSKAYYGDIVEFKTNSVEVQTSGSADLGLSVLWATANFGAVSPDEYGTYVASNNSALNFTDGWRLPTPDEAKELVDSCHWSWKKYRGVYGATVTSNDGTSIFIPANISVGDAYTYGVYMIDDLQDSRGYTSSFSFVQDLEDEVECQKNAGNRVSVDSEISVRLVKDR